ncbi:hypothetical protein U8527_11210 [Kordia algicida OT-1]|uniref:Uncharacterized protein n=1 Tax=Kordia algicida OT-1 TaxID=391587 RepID=A9EC61_9FLAO|nr:hypothetical protein [Kordia algicida]EDP94443.1 hypothetical protein KAOT1_04710 [Kordia algicida OT-1]
MSEQVKNLIGTLVDFQVILENKAVELKKLKEFKNVSRTSSFIGYPDEKYPSISSSLNADLSVPLKNDLHCLSFSFTFFPNKNNKWEIHSELGWSSYDEGFVDNKLIEEEYENLEGMLERIKPLTNELMKDLDIMIVMVQNG